MGWETSTSGEYFQKKYGKNLVRKMGKEFLVISLGQFAGLIKLQTKSLKEAIYYAKSR